MKDAFPQRIICLTEEPTEVLYLLGEQHRIVGISGFTVRPPEARKEKPKVSTFLDANVDKILALQPDLVIGFSDIQADIAKKLIEAGLSVWITNHRSVEEIYRFIVQLGSLTGRTIEAQELVSRFRNDLHLMCESNQQQSRKPRIYVEEWFDPLITTIRWVSELVELAGGMDIFIESRTSSLAKDRIIADPDEVVRRNPDIIIASWCGKAFKKQRMIARTGWSEINAVKHDFVFEIDSSILLQPGPAAVTDGVKAIADIIAAWHKRNNETNPA